jgi:hypothetical protein
VTTRTIWDTPQAGPRIEWSAVTEEDNRLSVGANVLLSSRKKRLAMLESVSQGKVWNNIRIPSFFTSILRYGGGGGHHRGMIRRSRINQWTLAERMTYHIPQQTTEAVVTLQNDARIIAVTVKHQRQQRQIHFNNHDRYTDSINHHGGRGQDVVKTQLVVAQQVGSNHVVTPKLTYDNQVELEWRYTMSNLLRKVVTTTWRNAEQDVTLKWNDGPWTARIYVPYCFNSVYNNMRQSNSDCSQTTWEDDDGDDSYHIHQLNSGDGYSSFCPIQIEGMRVEIRRNMRF